MQCWTLRLLLSVLPSFHSPASTSAASSLLPVTLSFFPLSLVHLRSISLHQRSCDNHFFSCLGLLLFFPHPSIILVLEISTSLGFPPACTDQVVPFASGEYRNCRSLDIANNSRFPSLFVLAYFITSFLPWSLAFVCYVSFFHSKLFDILNPTVTPTLHCLLQLFAQNFSPFSYEPSLCHGREDVD